MYRKANGLSAAVLVIAALIVMPSIAYNPAPSQQVIPYVTNNETPAEPPMESRVTAFPSSWVMPANTIPIYVRTTVGAGRDNGARWKSLDGTRCRESSYRGDSLMEKLLITGVV
jgi:hypothetical protein